MTLLTLQYRPHTFAELVGQDTARSILKALAFSEDVPPAVLFSGPSGTGKTSAARIFAAALNCPNRKNGDCCSSCSSCLAIQSGQSLSVQEVDAASNGGVDSIRSLKELAQFSADGPWRVIILDEAHAMSRQAFNALLKILEEPPAQTVFALITTEPNKIMATVRSRSMPIEFRQVSQGAIQSRLADICGSEGMAVDEDVLAEIADCSGGGMRDAVMLLDQATRVGALTLKTFRALVGSNRLPESLMEFIVVQDYDNTRRVLAEYFYQSANIAALISGLIEDLQDRFVKSTITRDQWVTSTKLLWDARNLGEVVNRDTRLRVEALVTLLFTIFRKDKMIVTKPILQEKKPEKSPEPAGLGLEEALAIL